MGVDQFPHPCRQGLPLFRLPDWLSPQQQTLPAHFPDHLALLTLGHHFLTISSRPWMAISFPLTSFSSRR
jgi:hypothetical protein